MKPAWLLAKLLLFGMIMIMFHPATRAQAGRGPHGPQALPDSCSNCHRAHRAGTGSLLVNEVPDLCLSCHGSASTGANTNVEDGVFSLSGDPLLGGGFRFFENRIATSSHSFDDSPQTAWGVNFPWPVGGECANCHTPQSGLPWPPDTSNWSLRSGTLPSLSLDENAEMNLTCTTCHQPHGGGNYRMLVPRVVFYPLPAEGESPPEVLVQSNETGGLDPEGTEYTPDYITPHYRQGLAVWCTGCHTHYHQERTSNPSPAGEEVSNETIYRHQVDVPLDSMSTSLPLEQPAGFSADLQISDQIFCLTCHYAHGTNVVTSGRAANVGPTGDSALLRLDNRGVCQDCHKK